MGFGTTNVDVNQPLRSALAEVGRSRLLHLSVGATELRVSMPEETHEEREVDLPDRWVRGFAETPLLAARANPVAELKGPSIGSFLGSLPRAADPGPVIHLLPVGAGFREVLARQQGTVTLAGSSRLRAASRVARFASHLSVHAAGHGTTAWCFTLPGGRLTLLLSPGPSGVSPGRAPCSSSSPIRRRRGLGDGCWSTCTGNLRSTTPLWPGTPGSRPSS